MAKRVIVQFVSAVFVLGLIVFVVNLSKTNYDPRGLEQQTLNTVVTSKTVKPAGTTPMYRSVGKQIHAISVTNEEEPTLFITIEGKNIAGVVSKESYKEISVGDRVEVTFLRPKYWGEPHVVSVLKK